MGIFISEGSVGRGPRRRGPVLMPFVDLVFRLKPISEVVPVFMAPVEPQFVRSLGDLFFQTDVGVRVKKRGGRFAGHLLFHEANSRQKAKQSQPEPQKSAKRFRDASIPASS